MTDDTLDVSIIGLPGSGKTTLLAAIWHSIQEPEADTDLKLHKLSNGNYEHLNALAKRWRAGEIQQRTQLSGMKSIEMRLINEKSMTLDITFPDVPGEEFSRMWELRELDKSIEQTMAASSIVLVINGDTIQFPTWVADFTAITTATGLNDESEDLRDWSADLAPTQVKIVDLLQLLMSDQLHVGKRRLSILVSAWDKVEDEGLTPAQLLKAKLPLLYQYLKSNRDPWTWKVWGLSAQGGVYEDPEKNQEYPETAALLDLDKPSDRIKVVDEKDVTTDITKPLVWLMS